jgi:heme-degrading monooxygenase HmoA
MQERSSPAAQAKLFSSEGNVVQIVWVFEARPDRLPEFENVYGVDGNWAKLFRTAEGYIDTALLRDLEKANHFLVIDRWHNRESFDSFKQHHAAAYDELDRQCEELTLVESKIGIFDS